MRNGICPKCESGAIYHAHQNGFYPASNHKYGLRVIEGEGWNASIVVINLQHYVCRDCGFFETYASTDDPAFAKIESSSNWKKL